MGEETLESLVQWGIDNKHLKGTPEFKAKADQYKQMRDNTQGSVTLPAMTVDKNGVEPPPPPPADEASVGPAGPAAAAPGDSNSFYNTASRVGVGALTGLPDLAIALANAGSRAGIFPPAKIPYLGPKVLDMIGAQPLAEDASVTRQLLEGGGSALLGGGATAALRAAAAAPTALRAVGAAISKLGTTTVAPTVLSHKGGEWGEQAANALGLDPETGALFGSIAGGAFPGGAASVPGRITDYRYRGMGKPNAPEIAAAARRQDVTLPASALGNDTIRMRENSNANRLGSSNFTQDIRTTARDQTGAAWNNMADARGSVNPTPTTGDIGAAIGDIARQNATDVRARASAPQEALAQRVGPDSPADWLPILSRLRQLSDETYAGTAQPLDSRIARIESRLPVDARGNITSTQGTYNQVKDFRSDTRIAGEGYDPIPSRYAGGAEDAATAVMRDTAVQRGVPGPAFDRTQERYAAAMGEGGPHERLTSVADNAANNAESGYNYVKRGEQDPARLVQLEATGQPRTRAQPITPLDQTLGDYLRLIGNQTINSPNQGAPGPRQLATRIEGIQPHALDVIAGPQRGAVDDIALLARALNAPTRQGGLGQTMGQINRDIPASLTAGEIGHSIGSATGVTGAPTAGRAIGYALGPIRRAIGGRVMQGPTAMRALEGLPYQSNYTMSDLVAALTAASQSQTQGAPLPGPRAR